MQQPITDRPTGDPTRPSRNPSRLTLVSINSRGIPLLGSQLRQRYRAIGRSLDSNDVDVDVDLVCVQEAFTYYHLELLARAMPSFRHLSCRPSLAGPAGGLVTFSRRPVGERRYRRFPAPPTTPDLPRLTRVKALLKGVLLTKLVEPALWVANTHPAANLDGDWSESNRFAQLHRAQLHSLATILRSTGAPAVVCGDFNVARDSSLHRAFMAETQLVDAFSGQCPPTFHSAYLDTGRQADCIDFILVTPTVAVERTATVFTDREQLPDGSHAHVSDHIGLRATIVPPN